MNEPWQFEIPGADRRALKLDVYRPDPSQSLQTAVILLHGGALRVGSRKDVAPYARLLAKRGFLAVAAEYRLLGEAAYPAQLNDVMDVIGWVSAEAAQLGINPGKIAVEGFSAGAHLALLAAGKSVDRPDIPIAAVVSFYAPIEMEIPPAPGMPSRGELVLGQGASAAQIRALSPIHQVVAGFPATFLLAGTADWLLAPGETSRMFESLIHAGVAAELHLYHGHSHEFAALPSMLEPVQDEVTLFLKRSVVDPAAYADENLELNPFARPGVLPAMPNQEPST